MTSPPPAWPRPHDLTGWPTALADCLPRRPRDGLAVRGRRGAADALAPAVLRVARARATCSHPHRVHDRRPRRRRRTGTRPGHWKTRPATTSAWRRSMLLGVNRRIPQALRGPGPDRDGPQGRSRRTTTTSPCSAPAPPARARASARRSWQPVLDRLRRGRHRRLPRVVQGAEHPVLPAPRVRGRRGDRVRPRRADLWAMWRDPQPRDRRVTDLGDGPSPERPAPPMKRSGSFLVAAGIFLSSTFGLDPRGLRSPAFLGVGATADVFKAAVRIPNLIQNLLGEGCCRRRSSPCTRASSRRTATKAEDLAGNDPRAAARGRGRHRGARRRARPARSPSS